MKYYYLVEVTKPNGEKYMLELQHDMPALGRLLISKEELEQDWARKDKEHGRPVNRYKIITRQVYMRLTDVGPPWLRTAIGGLIFWIILLGLLYLAEAPWLK